MKSIIAPAFALVLAAGLLSACDSAKSDSARSGSAAGDPAKQCQEFVRKLEKCDPTAGDMPADVREEMLRECPPTAAKCAGLPVETNAQCSKFMGCLYEDE